MPSHKEYTNIWAKTRVGSIFPGEGKTKNTASLSGIESHKVVWIRIP